MSPAHRPIFLSSLIATLLPGALAAAEPNIRPGLWEWRSNMEMAGMPYAMPEHVHQECLTREQLVPKDQQDQGCAMTDVRIEASRVTWNVSCNTPDGSMTGAGEMEYQGDTATGTFNMQGAGVQMLTRLQGRRLGDCR